MMISTPKRTGRATSIAALRISAIRPSRVGSSAPPAARRRTKLSIITTAPSTMRPKSMAPSDIRFAEMPNTRIPMKPTSMESGMTAATMSAARTSRRKMNRTRMTSRQPSMRFRRTVAEVRSMTSLWS